MGAIPQRSRKTSNHSSNSVHDSLVKETNEIQSDNKCWPVNVSICQIDSNNKNHSPMISLKKKHMNFTGVLEIFLALQDALRPSREGIFWYIQISPNTKRNSLSNPIAWSSIVIGFILTISHTSCSFHIIMSASHSIKRYNWTTLFLLSFHSYLFPTTSFWTFTLPSPFHPSWKIQEIWVSQWHLSLSVHGLYHNKKSQ